MDLHSTEKTTRREKEIQQTFLLPFNLLWPENYALQKNAVEYHLAEAELDESLWLLALSAFSK